MHPVGWIAGSHWDCSCPARGGKRGLQAWERPGAALRVCLSEAGPSGALPGGWGFWVPALLVAVAAWQTSLSPSLPLGGEWSLSRAPSCVCVRTSVRACACVRVRARACVCAHSPPWRASEERSRACGGGLWDARGPSLSALNPRSVSTAPAASPHRADLVTSCVRPWPGPGAQVQAWVPSAPSCWVCLLCLSFTHGALCCVCGGPLSPNGTLLGPPHAGCGWGPASRQLGDRGGPALECGADGGRG